MVFSQTSNKHITDITTLKYCAVFVNSHIDSALEQVHYLIVYVLLFIWQQ